MDNNYIGMKLDGRYELVERIGAGGMAEIYKAMDSVEDKVVAVKILKNEFAGSEEFLRRFRNESKAIALLSHPNIVNIFDVGFTESVRFIVMEYIDGITLTEYINRNGVLKWKEALGYVEQILKALQHAHDRGIVHRDVKSQNVMLLSDKSIKVMDFGIARFNREIDKTMAEKAIGSVHYISPEQAKGEMTDERSDIYSTGVILYEALTGVKPFDGEDALSIALMHTNTMPKRPREINSAIPEGLEEITLRAMQKDPALRYQTAGEMVNDLKELEKNPSVIFEYKYNTPGGGAKFLDKAGNPSVNPMIAAAPKGRIAAAQYAEDEDDYDDEVIERRSPLLPILFAVASAFVIVAAILITSLVTNMFNARGDRMPDLVGMTIDQVRAQYGEDIWIEFSREFSPTIPRDHVISQDISPGTVISRHQPVNVVVSRGREIVSMPAFTSMTTEEEAFARLKDLGVEPVVSKIYDENVPEGFFVRSEREAGEELDKGEVVRIYISMGPPGRVNMTFVPDFVGMTLESAQARAQEAEIRIIERYQASPEELRGRVISQGLEKDLEVQKFTPIEIVIGSGPEDTEPPSEPGNPGTLGFNFPPGLSGLYEISYWIDGVWQNQEVVDVSIRTQITWNFRDTGVKTYSIRIKDLQTNRDGVYCMYSINFDGEEAVMTEIIRNENILNEISAAE